MISGHRCTLEVNWNENSDWVSFDMEFNKIYKDWSIKVTRLGASADIPVSNEPSEDELTQWQQEFRQVAYHLREALIYIMNILQISDEPSSPVKYSLTGPNYIRKNLPLQCSYTLVIQNSSPPSVDDIQRFWSDLKRNQIYKEAVGHYVKAFSTGNETEKSSELYKAIELFKNRFHGWNKAADSIGYPFPKWEKLRYNLNRERHVSGHPGKASKIQLISIRECFGEVKEIIEMFRQKHISAN